MDCSTSFLPPAVGVSAVHSLTFSRSALRSEVGLKSSRCCCNVFSQN